MNDDPEIGCSWSLVACFVVFVLALWFSGAMVGATADREGRAQGIGQEAGR